MRKTPIILVVLVFALWFAVKGRPFLDVAQPEVYSTPTVQPQNAAELGDAKVKHGQQLCADQIAYGPGAKYVLVTVLTSQPKGAGALRFDATAPGYSAEATVPAGSANNQQVIVPIKPAPREIAGGKLCITNLGRHQVGFYAIGSGGPENTASVTRIDGTLTQLDLSITLLTSPSRTLGARLGTVFDHMAAFNPLSGWVVWVLFLLVLIAVPIAIGTALGRAAALDDRADAPPPREPRGGW